MGCFETMQALPHEPEDEIIKRAKKLLLGKS
jgi:hypothetical protein